MDRLPAYEIDDRDKEIEIAVDLPGVLREDIDIVFESGYLKVTGTRKMKKKQKKDEEEKEEEPTVWKLSRKFSLDDQTVDTDNILATLENGVLTILIPKKELEEPVIKRIDIV